MRFYGILLVTSASFAALGCATAPPPQELVDARAAIARAQGGKAQEVNPAQLHDAETALNRAERAYENEPGAPEVVDLAAIARLKATTAESESGAAISRRDKLRAEKDLVAVQRDKLNDARVDTTVARADAQRASADANRTRGQLGEERQKLEAERQKRLETEKKLRDTLATLDKIASIKDTDRGMVISLQGDVLFKPNMATLRPEAMAKLTQIAEQLRGQERKLVIEGHTDSQGGNGKFNQDLSEKRANAVKEFLLTQGIPSDLVSANGFGPTKPVAENTSVEGRSANRRVEIIVEPKR